MLSNTVILHCCLYFNKIISADAWKGVKWMNSKALPRQAYNPTPIEHMANIVTHGVLVPPSVFAMYKLVERSINGAQFLSALVYGFTLVLLFCISTSFHYTFFLKGHGQLKNVLHRCDRAMIYVFIAGSYFPWLTLQHLPTEGWSSSMKWVVWLLAALGIMYQQTFHEKYKMLELIFYLVMGLGPALPFIFEHDFLGMTELKIGGLLYVMGVFFFKSDGVIPCAHAIWHLFVVLAAATHYYAIYNYLYPTISKCVGIECS